MYDEITVSVPASEIDYENLRTSQNSNQYEQLTAGASDGHGNRDCHNYETLELN